MTHTCYSCKEIKDLSLFYKNASKKSGYSGRCKKCDNKMKDDWRKKNPEKVKLMEKKRNKRGRRGKKEADRARNRKYRKELSDQYICYLIRRSSTLLKEDMPDELIEATRLNLKLKRALKLTAKLKPST